MGEMDSRNFPWLGLVTTVILQGSHCWRVVYIFFCFFSFCTVDALCIFSSRLTMSNAGHEGNGLWQIDQMYFPQSIFSSVFSTWRYANIYISIACNDTEGTKFQRRNGKHREWNLIAHIDILSDTNVSQFCRVPMYVPPSRDWKKLRSNECVFEVYRRLCNKTKRFGG